MKHSSFDATISALDAELSALNVEMSAIAQSYRRYRTEFLAIAVCV